jgi:signal transduction histidine kinase/CheY-like chemotaxis protein
MVHADDIKRVSEEVARYTADHMDAFVQEYRIRAADGRVLWVDDRTTVVRDAAGVVVRYEGTLADITERKQLQAQFVQAQKMETVGRLAGGVAHDFNNLLTVINGYAEFALSDIPPEDPLHEMVQEIYDAGQRASGLTRQLLAFSRRQVVQPVSLDLNVVAEQMHKMLERLIGEDVRLTFDLDPGLGRVRADAGQFEQVIMNLAVNSRDAMPQGGTLVVMTRNLDEAHEIMLSVSDTGCGMDEATQQRLFEPFFTTKKAGQGTGLGLATVYGIVTQAGGRIEVSSAVGRGSTFRVYLPRLAGDTGSDVTTARPTGLAGGTERVLIVEDEESLRRIAQRILTAAGYTTLCAANGDEAIRILDGEGARVDLLLTDVVMPGMSGHELAARVTVTHPHLKVLFASGYLPDAFPDRGRLGPDVQFLAKPYSPSSLTAKVRDVLDRT